MATNSRTTSAKRHKERARQEKQAEKAARRAQRKLDKESPSGDKPKEVLVTYDEEGNPQGLGFHDF